jgi:hypothetical protein
MPLPTGITSPVNQNKPLSNTSMHGRSSAGHNDGLSSDHNGIISDDRFDKEISELLGDGAIDQTNSITSHLALHMMQAQTFFVLPDAVTTTLAPVLNLQGQTDTVRPFIFMNEKTLGPDQDTGFNPQGTVKPTPPYPLHPLLKDLLLSGDPTDIIGKEGLDSSDTNLRPGSFQDNHAIKENGSRAFEPIKIIPLGAGETGPDHSILACQSGDRGDPNNKPGLERETEIEIDKKNGLPLQRGPSNKGDFRGALENCSDKVPDRIIPDSNPDLNLNGSFTRLPAPSGNTTSAKSVPVRSASPEKTSFSFHEISDISSKRPIYLFKEDTSSVRINLDGDDFGKLKLAISVRDHMVKATIVTEHTIVKEMIEINQGQLKDALSGQGIEMSYLSVSVEGGQSEGLNYKEVIENTSTRKDHDRELKEEDAILACHTLSHQDSGVNIFV